MKKKLFTLLLCLFAVLGANAALEFSNNNGHIVISYDGNGNYNLKNHRKDLGDATSLELKGTFSADNLNTIKDLLGTSMTDLNLSHASIHSDYTLAGNL